MPPRRPAASEEHLEAAMRDLIQLFGLYGYHTRRSDGSEAGFPDWYIEGPSGFIFVELKRDGEHPTPAQAAVLSRMRAHGITVFVWRNADLRAGTIHSTLRALSRRSSSQVWPPTVPDDLAPATAGKATAQTVTSKLDVASRKSGGYGGADHWRSSPKPWNR